MVLIHSNLPIYGWITSNQFINTFWPCAAISIYIRENYTVVRTWYLKYFRASHFLNCHVWWRISMASTSDTWPLSFFHWNILKFVDRRFHCKHEISFNQSIISLFSPILIIMHLHQSMVTSTSIQCHWMSHFPCLNNHHCCFVCVDKRQSKKYF